MDNPIRILILNEQKLICNLITGFLSREPDMEVRGSFTSFDEARPHLSKCDILLVSTRLPNQEALTVTRKVFEESYKVKIVILGLTESLREVIQYIEAGALGYILKDDSAEAFLKTIRATASNEAIVSPKIAAAMMTRLTSLSQLFSNAESVLFDADSLTEREQEVLKLVGEGLSNLEIGIRLFIEVGTVKNHVHNILKKLNVNSRQIAAAYFALAKHDHNFAPASFQDTSASYQDAPASFHESDELAIIDGIGSRNSRFGHEPTNAVP